MHTPSRKLQIVFGIVLLGVGVVVAGCGPAGNNGSGRPTNAFDPHGGANGKGGAGVGASNGGAKDGGADSDATLFVIDFPDALQITDAPGSGMEKKDTLEACGVTAFEVERVPPDLMIVLDRSGSMLRTTDGKNPAYPSEMATGIPTRWSYTRKALESVLTDTENDISWGIKTFPTCAASSMVFTVAEAGTRFPPAYACLPDACSIDGAATQPALANKTSLVAQLALAESQLQVDKGATPTAPAVDEAVALLKARNNTRPKYILLATDGQPNCGVDPTSMARNWAVDDTAGAVKAVADAKAAGIDVFVLGIAIKDPGATADATLLKAHQTLNMMADAGGRARMGDIKYYPATDQTDLSKAVADIAAATVSCTLPLTQEPPANASTRLDIDQVMVAESPTEGWSFGAGRTNITLNGSYCDKRKRGDLKKVVISFTCPGKVPPPPPVAL